MSKRDGDETRDMKPRNKGWRADERMLCARTRLVVEDGGESNELSMILAVVALEAEDGEKLFVDAAVVAVVERLDVDGDRVRDGGLFK